MPDYDFYLQVYHGKDIPLEEWTLYVHRAGEQLARYRRIYQVTAPGPDSGAMAACAVAEALYTFDLLANGEAGPVKSASIGSVSVGYGDSGDQTIDLSSKGQSRELYRRACLYLDIYRGCS